MTAAAKAAPSKAANATPLEITADRTSLSESASGYRQGERTEAVHTKQPAPQAQTREDRAAGSSASTAPLQDSALEGWYIEYSRPPATAVLTTTTSLTYAELQERLRLDDETVSAPHVDYDTTLNVGVDALYRKVQLACEHRLVVIVTLAVRIAWKTCRRPACVFKSTVT